MQKFLNALIWVCLVAGAMTGATYAVADFFARAPSTMQFVLDYGYQSAAVLLWAGLTFGWLKKRFEVATVPETLERDDLLFGTAGSVLIGITFAAAVFGPWTELAFLFYLIFLCTGLLLVVFSWACRAEAKIRRASPAVSQSS